MLEKILTEQLQLLLTIGAMVFAAGGAWVTLRIAQRDVNGLGRKVNHKESIDNDRYNRLCIAIMSLAPEQKTDLMKLLGGADK